MSTLHLVSSSPFADSRLSSCLRLLAPGDGLLLCGDASYALHAENSHAAALLQLEQSIEIFVLAEDLQARNLRPIDRVQAIDYVKFVALTCAFDKVNTWL